MALTRKIKTAYESPALILARANVAYLSRLRVMALRIQARAHGGEVAIGQRVRVVHPTRFQGRGHVLMEDDVTLGYWLSGAPKRPILLQPRATRSIIRVGEGSSVVNGTEIYALQEVCIGKRCYIGAGVRILDSDFHGVGLHERRTEGVSSPVRIEDNVWLGIEALVLKGVTIGRDAVVGARCVVSKDVPNGGIVVGNPMRQIGSVYV